jgi:hypothetical protein
MPHAIMQVPHGLVAQWWGVAECTRKNTIITIDQEEHIHIDQNVIIYLSI